MDMQKNASNIILLKLGGSLITEKGLVSVPRPEVISRLASEISLGYTQLPGLRLILGHGSGSFGHVPAEKYKTRLGVKSPDQWHGFAAVWREATQLTRIVINALHKANLPAVAFSPSAGAFASNGVITSWDLAPLEAALEAGLLPVVHGDVAFDKTRGGTIVSTEDVFSFLASKFAPQRVLIAGSEPGVWADFPACTEIIPTLTLRNINVYKSRISGSASTDVTGGMAGKVEELLKLSKANPGLENMIFSGLEPGAVTRAIRGETFGTRVHA